ncbi:MAG: hypothetical protein PHD01_01645 [Geobacteraceae bacterium]|nr:hypothetical protein [Geobacteraceae bacterium]
MKASVIIKYLSLCFLMIFILFLLRYKQDIKLIFYGERFDFKVYNSPSKRKTITLVLHTEGWVSYESHIYILPGIYHSEMVPHDTELIKFPNGAGVLVKWIGERKLDIISSKQPEINKLTQKDYKIDLIVDRQYIDKVQQEGGQVVRYKIF